ncbi:MAG: hypothetical protein QXR73_03980, partial [Candidatus Micrarchaeaceae archaeon]
MKAQSAVEYLITYGWAILLVAVAVSLLYLYVAVPKAIVPSTCNFVTGVVCQDMILGTNTTTHATEIGLFLINPQQYPIYNPKIYATINGKNTSAIACKPSFILAGGSVICVLPAANVSSSFNQFFSGNLYLNVSYCGLAPKPASLSSCATVPKETYKGTYSAHAQPLVYPGYTLALSVQNSTNPANNMKDMLSAHVDLLGYVQSGATVNFTATFTKNGTNAVPPYSMQSQYATTGTNGQAVDYIWGTKVSNVTVKASYAGLNATKTINFLAVVPAYFTISNITSSLQSSLSTIATIDGVSYSYSQLTHKPTNFDWGCNTTHTYSFDTIIYNSSGTRYVFQNILVNGFSFTNNSGSITISTCKAQSILVNYAPQYELYTTPSPTSGGTVSPKTSWYSPNTGVTISETPNTTGHYVFVDWTCNGSGCYSGTAASTSVTVSNPINETAVFQTTVTSTSTSTTSTSTIAPTLTYVELVINNTQNVSTDEYSPLSTSASANSPSSLSFSPSSQSFLVAVPYLFDQEVFLNASKYKQYEKSNLSNIKFTTGPADTGSAIDAWIQNNASYNSPNTIIWLRLTTPIPADSTQIVYMNFMPNSVMSSSGPTGEAPQLSPTYAEYDDGADVFNTYYNFSGTTLS